MTPNSTEERIALIKCKLHGVLPLSVTSQTVADAANAVNEALTRTDSDVSGLVEALTVAVTALGRVNVRCFDRAESPLKPIGDIAREALANIALTVGCETYDKLAADAESALAKHRQSNGGVE